MLTQDGAIVLFVVSFTLMLLLAWHDNKNDPAGFWLVVKGWTGMCLVLGGIFWLVGSSLPPDWKEKETQRRQAAEEAAVQRSCHRPARIPYHPPRLLCDQSEQLVTVVEDRIAVDDEWGFIPGYTTINGKFMGIDELRPCH